MQTGWQADTTLGRHTPPPRADTSPLAGRQPPQQADTPPPQQMATVADGTHPTGMQSCLNKILTSSVADLRSALGTSPLPLDPNSFNFMQFFWEFLAKSYVGAPLPTWRVGAPTSGESWIRHSSWWGWRKQLAFHLIVAKHRDFIF